MAPKVILRIRLGINMKLLLNYELWLLNTTKPQTYTDSNEKYPLDFFLRFLFIYSQETQRERQREREREREAETQAEGEAGSMQGARHGTRSWVPRIRPWAEGSAKPLSHPGIPKILKLNHPSTTNHPTGTFNCC